MRQDTLKIKKMLPLHYMEERNDEYGKWATGRGTKAGFLDYDDDVKDQGNDASSVLERERGRTRVEKRSLTATEPCLSYVPMPHDCFNRVRARTAC